MYDAQLTVLILAWFCFKLWFFFNITRLFAMGLYFSEVKFPNSSSNEKRCHNFSGLIMQDLPHLTQFFVHNWHQNRHIDNNTIIIARWEEREVFFRFSARKNFGVPETRTHDLCVLSAAFSRNLDERLFWPRSSGIFSALVQWLVGRNGTNFTGLAAVPIMTLDWPRLTSLYPFSIQTAASHGLDYSTALPVPAITTKLLLALPNIV